MHFLCGWFDGDVCEMSAEKDRVVRRREESPVNGLPTVVDLSDPYFVKIFLIISNRKYCSAFYKLPFYCISLSSSSHYKVQVQMFEKTWPNVAEDRELEPDVRSSFCVFIGQKLNQLGWKTLRINQLHDGILEPISPAAYPENDRSDERTFKTD